MTAMREQISRSARDRATADFFELSKRIKASALLDRRYGWYIARAVILAVGLVILTSLLFGLGRTPWQLLNAVAFALLLTQWPSSDMTRPITRCSLPDGATNGSLGSSPTSWSASATDGGRASTVGTTPTPTPSVRTTILQPARWCSTLTTLRTEPGRPDGTTANRGGHAFR